MLFAVTGADNPATLALAPQGTPLYKLPIITLRLELGSRISCLNVREKKRFLAEVLASSMILEPAR